MNAFDVPDSDKAKMLMSMTPGKDYVWAAVKCDLFQTYRPFASDKARYFGSYERPYRDTSYSINCIEGVSPKVYKLKKLLYLGNFEAKGTFDKLFVFHDASKDRNDLRFSGYVLAWKYGYRNYNTTPEISADVFANFDFNHELDIDLVAFTKEDGLEICRELNSKWKNDMRYIGFGEKGKYIKKTLKSMLKQLDCFMNSEYMIDHKAEIEKELNSQS